MLLIWPESVIRVPFRILGPAVVVVSLLGTYSLRNNVGDLVVLRLACSVFGAVGVAAGLLAARRLSRNWLFLAATALAHGLTLVSADRRLRAIPGVDVLTLG
mgnify:CR=1 FL=1